MASYMITYICMASFLEWFTSLKCMEKHLIKYSAKVSRAEAVEKTRKNVPYQGQFYNVLDALMGVSAIFNGLGIFVVVFVIGQMDIPGTPLPPSFAGALRDFVVMELFGDFLLYCGHRLQHDVQYLYDVSHSFHHTLETPTPLGTGYTKPLDGMLQHSLPVAILIATVRPHPITLYLYIAWRISESVWNHSGVDHWIVDAVTLKFLPGRAPIAHHDAHHKYSSYSQNAKNFGEAFWIWDYAFGTYSAYRNVNSLAKKQQLDVKQQ